ncbi:poly(A)-specific ribonuclease, partial [Ascoidea rubescens DSM 1968]
YRPRVASALKFDDAHELIWVGDSKGFVSSYNGNDLSFYTGFQASSHKNPVLKFLNHSNSNGLLSLSSDALKFTNTGGNLVKNYDSFSDFKNMKSMTFINSKNQNQILIAGDLPSNSLLKFDINYQKVISRIPYNQKVSFLNSNNNLITIGKSNGELDIMDLNSKKNLIIKSLQCHSSTFADIDLKNNLLVTSGTSKRHSSTLIDPIINVYDLRMLKSLPPLSFQAGPSFLRLHHKLSNTIAISSPSGQVQFVDMFNQANFSMYQVSTGVYLNNMDLSTSGNYLAFCDNLNSLHLWSINPDHSSMCNHSVSLQYPTIPDFDYTTKQSFHIDDYSKPLSLVGMPYYKDILLSAWKSDLIFPAKNSKIPKKIDNELLIKSKKVDGIIYSNYDKSKYGRRNLYQKYQSVDKNKKSGLSIPKFISQKTIKPNNRHNVHDFIDENNESLKNLNINSDNNSDSDYDDDEISIKQKIFQLEPSKEYPNKIPRAFQKLEILYSKFGINDFNFEFYNKSKKYSGLETHIENSYMNSLLQVYRFIPELFNFLVENLREDFLNLELDVKNNRTYSSDHISSILIEFGFLLDMMVKAKGKHCRPTNFQIIMSSNPQAFALGLLNFSENLKMKNIDENEPTEEYLKNIVQSFNRFFLDRLSYDEQKQKEFINKSNLKLNENINLETVVQISACKFSKQKYEIIYTLDVFSSTAGIVQRYGEMGSFFSNSINKRYNNIPQTILSYIESSMNRVSATRGWCDKCHKYQTMETTRVVRNLPKVLSLNLNFTKDEWGQIRHFNISNKQRPESLDESNSSLGSISNTSTKNRKNYNNEVVKYELMGYVAEIAGNSEESSHLVSFVKIYDENKEPCADDADTQKPYKWYLFNDFLIMPIPEEEVFNITYWWKTPLILIYQSNKASNEFKSNFDTRLNDEVLYRDFFAQGTREGKIIEYELLTDGEAPNPGSLVAIDAEFVLLEREEVELRSDGTRSLIKPQKQSLARVSVLRGDNGPKQGVPFIDDYIIIRSTIADYLTSFSGIEPGDLDPATSKRSLVYLEVAYRKLWLLLQLGCVFIGHGLTNDFRIINIQVPKEQVRDTIELYFKPDQKRKLSLKFLSYFVLKQDVQLGNHDSIEDALTALKLYKKYLELKAIGEFENTLDNIYHEGQRLRFKPPE